MATTILIAVLAFLTIAGLGFAFAGGGESNSRAAKRAQAIAGSGPARGQSRIKAAAAAGPDSRRKQILRTLKEQEKRQKKVSLSLAARLQQAGLSASVQQFWIASGVVGVLAAGALLVFRQPYYIGLGAGFAAGLGLPRWILGFLAKRRTKKFTQEFSDAIDVIVRGIKSGLPVHDCLKIIAREATQPLAGEFQRLNENISVGLSVEQALEKMYERMPTPELRFFTIVLTIQQKTGGNLAEALGNLSAVLRARKMMREKIKALSSEATASAFIIGCLPPGVVVLITVTTPSYMSPMFTTDRGHMFLLGGAIWMSLGIFVMRKMINFKF